MRGGKAERDAQAMRPPGAPAVGPAPLGRDLGRTLLPPMMEQSGEEDRLIGYRARQLVEAVERDIRVRRDEIEIPLNGDGHGGENREKGKGMDGNSFASRR